MKLAFTSALLFLLVAACTRHTEISADKIKTLPATMDLSGYSRIHEFHTKDGTALAALYGKTVAPGFFSELLFVDERDNVKRILYLADRDRFLGVQGVEEEIGLPEFYGYTLKRKGPDSLVVNYTTNGGKDPSDNRTFYWNYEAKRFQRQDVP